MATRKARSEEETEKPDPRAEKEDPKGEDEVLELEVGGEEDDEEEGDASEEEPRTQKQKKSSWVRAKEEATRARQEADQLRRQLAEAEAQRAAFFAQQQAQHGASQLEQEVERVYQEQNDLFTAFEARRTAGNMTEAEMKEFAERARKVEEKKIHLQVMRAGGGRQQMSPEQLLALANQQRIVQRYQDIFAVPQARMYGEAEVQRRVALGEQYNDALLDDVAAETRKRFGLANGNGGQPYRPAPDQATRARYSGVSARASAPDSGSVVKVEIGRRERMLARSLYPDLPEDKAVQKWAKGPGRRAALAARAKER